LNGLLAIQTKAKTFNISLFHGNGFQALTVVMLKTKTNTNTDV